MNSSKGAWVTSALVYVVLGAWIPAWAEEPDPLAKPISFEMIDIPATIPRGTLQLSASEPQRVGYDAQMFDRLNRSMTRARVTAEKVAPPVIRSEGQNWHYHWQFYLWLAGGGMAEPPYTLVMQLPAESQEISVPFEFIDVPLP